MVTPGFTTPWPDRRRISGAVHALRQLGTEAAGGTSLLRPKQKLGAVVAENSLQARGW
jgi:hypothetical protein